MVHRSNYDAERSDLLARLGRMEGQVRGLGRMIEDDRYCLDVVQQVNAVTAGLREVALLVLEAHLRVSVAEAVAGGDRDAAIAETVELLRRAMRP